MSTTLELTGRGGVLTLQASLSTHRGPREVLVNVRLDDLAERDEVVGALLAHPHEPGGVITFRGPDVLAALVNAERGRFPRGGAAGGVAGLARAAARTRWSWLPTLTCPSLRYYHALVAADRAAAGVADADPPGHVPDDVAQAWRDATAFARIWECLRGAGLARAWGERRNLRRPRAFPDEYAPIVATMPGTGLVYLRLEDGWFVLSCSGERALEPIEVAQLALCPTPGPSRAVRPVRRESSRRVLRRWATSRRR